MGLECLSTYYEEARPELGSQGIWDSWCYVGTSGRGVLVEATVNRLIIEKRQLFGLFLRQKVKVN